jgi:hypothetical protein
MREPDFIIKDWGQDRMYRWFLIPRNKWINIYLHKLVNPDLQDLHDHEYDNVSIVLKGGYFETTPVDKKDTTRLYFKATKTRFRKPGSIIFRRAEWAHRLSPLYRGAGEIPYAKPIVVPCWSLFITFRRRRNWGFHTRHGWVAFKDLGVPYEKGISDVTAALHRYNYGERDD